MFVGSSPGMNALSSLGSSGAAGGLGESIAAKLTDKMGEIADRISQEMSSLNGKIAEVKAREANGGDQRTDGANGGDGCGGAQGGGAPAQPHQVARAEETSEPNQVSLPKSISSQTTLGEAARESGATPEQLLNGLRNGDIAIDNSGGSATAE